MQKLKPLPSKRERIEKAYFYGTILFVLIAFGLLAFSCTSPQKFSYKDHYKKLHSPSAAELATIATERKWERAKETKEVNLFNAEENNEKK